MLITAGDLFLEIAYGATEGGVSGNACFVATDEYGIMIVNGFSQNIAADAVVDDALVDTSVPQIFLNPVSGRTQFGKPEDFCRSGFGNRGDNRANGSFANNCFHSFCEGIAFDMDQVIQSSFSSDSPGEPIPLTVADFQTVMLAGAVGGGTFFHQFLGVEVLQIG